MGQGLRDSSKKHVTIKPMSRSLAELAREAVELPQQQRLTLARILLDTSDASSEPLPEVEAAWEDEIAQRIRAIDAGQVQGKPWDAVLADINKRFKW
jgi:putative addiction module component (TIGR02574 family)